MSLSMSLPLQKIPRQANKQTNNQANKLTKKKSQILQNPCISGAARQPANLMEFACMAEPKS